MAYELGIWDYVIIVAMLCISTAIGLYFRFTGGRQKTIQEFFMGGKNMSILPVAFSLMASFMSASTMIGLPADIYLYGLQVVLKLTAFIFGGIFASYVYLPVFYDMNVSTAYEYLQRRFGRKIRSVASFMFSLQMVFYMGINFYAPCIALNAVTGLSTWGAIAVLAIICTLYSTLGGLKAVLWTDVFQAILMFMAVISVAVKGTMDIGGFKNVLHAAKQGGRTRMLNFSVSLEERYTVWNTLISGFITKLTIFGCNQTEIQRILSVRSLKSAKRALYFSLILIMFFNAFCAYNGLVLYSIFYNCDPILRPAEKHLNSNNQLIPHTILKLFECYPGFPGLCIAGIFSASLSSVSSAMNSLATVTVEDFIRPYCFCYKLQESWATLIAKLIAIAYGGVCLFMSIIVGKLRGLYEASSTLTGMVGGPILGVFTLGMLTTAANEEGVLIGLVAGFSLNAWMAFGSHTSKVKVPSLPRSIEGCSEVMEARNGSIYNSSTFTNFYGITDPAEQNKHIFPLYRVTYLWFVVFGFMTVVSVGYIASIFIDCCQQKRRFVKPECISPVVRKWYFPKSSTDNEKFENAVKDSDVLEKEIFENNYLNEATK